MTKNPPSVTIVRHIKASPAKIWAAITQGSDAALFRRRTTLRFYSDRSRILPP